MSEDMVARLRAAEERWGLAFTLYWLGSSVLAQTGDAALAQPIFEEIRTLADTWLRAEALDHLGVVAGMRGNYAAVQAYFEQSLAYHRTIGDDWALARGLAEYGEAALQHGDLVPAEELFQKSLRLWWALGNTPGMLACLGGLARTAAADGRGRRAACLYGATPELVYTVGWLFLHASTEEYKSYRAHTQRELGEAWGKAYKRVQKMALETAVRNVLNGAETRT